MAGDSTPVSDSHSMFLRERESFRAAHFGLEANFRNNYQILGRVLMRCIAHLMLVCASLSATPLITI